jgi:beta-lactamase superfamily II metal-dependent hydrolase
MIDTGYYETSGKVLAYLKRKKVERLNCLIISHYDKDHVGGAIPIISKVHTEKIYLPDYEGRSAYYEALADYIEKNRLDASQVSSDISLDYDRMHLDIYASDIAYDYDTVKEEGNDNDVCVTAALFFGDDSWLFAGDLETEGIAGFLAANRGPFDVVKMPHHGRKASNTKEFIESTAPMIAVITDSKDEKAKKKVVKWLTEQGANVYSSSVNGDITITGNGHEEYEID